MCEREGKALQHYDVILFDVDGTLIDSAPGILNTLEEVFHKMNVDITGVDLRRYLALYGYGSREELEPFHPVFYAESCAALADELLNV